jgi:hypothetical protein
MRLVTLLVTALCLGAEALGGCSNSSAAGDGGVPPVDAASGPQPLGDPCDPAIASPCLATGDDCLGVYCDPNALVCVEYVTDAGPPCGAGAAPCATSTDCDLGLTCGFPIGGGCNAQGACVNVPVECEDDAAACQGGGTACACSGLAVPVHVAGYASAPTPSGPSGPGACGPDAGPEGAGPSSDAGAGAGAGEGGAGS